MRFFNKLKSVMLVAASLFCFNEAFADTALIAWGNCSVGSIEGTDVNNQLTGNTGDTAEGFVLQLTGNDKKTYSAAGVKFDVPLPDGTSGSRTAIKLSNGAQNTLILPEGKVATKVTFHSYLNYDPAAKGKDGRTSYWKEVDGVSYTAETATNMSCWLNGKTIGDPDVISFDLDKKSSFTFTNTGEQTCVIISVEYEDASAATPSIEGLAIATAVAAGADPDTVKVDFTVNGQAQNALYIFGADGAVLSGVKYGMSPMPFNPAGFDEMGLLKVEDGQECHWEILVPKNSYGEARSECDATLAFSLIDLNEETFDMVSYQLVSETVHFEAGVAPTPSIEGFSIATAVAAGADPDTVKVDFIVNGQAQNALYIWGADGAVLSGIRYGMSPMPFNPAGFDEMGLLKVEDGQECHWEILVPKTSYGEARSECDATLAFMLIDLNEETFDMVSYQSVSETVHFTAVSIVEAISLDQEAVEIEVGATATLAATFTPADAVNTADLVWTSNDENIATVENGVITAVAPGTTTIEAAIEDIKAVCTVTVVEAAAKDDNMTVVKNWDFAAMVADVTGEPAMTYSDETVKVGGTDCNLGTGAFEGLAMQGANKFLVRPKSGGLYQGNGGGRKVGVLDLVPGQVVVIVTSGECMTLADATTAEQVSMETADGKTTYTYKMTAEGILALNMTRYFTIYSIEVKQQTALADAANWDFAAMSTEVTENTPMTYSDETVKVGGTACNLGTGAFEGLAMQAAGNFLVHPKNGGLYSNNGGGRKVGVLNMTNGAIITVVTNGDCMTLADATTAEETSKETVDGKTTYVYTMTEDGILALNMARYFTIYSIKVQKVVKYVAAPNWDFAAMSTEVTENTPMTYSDETVKVGGTASNLGTGAFEGLAMQAAGNFLIHPKNGGLYSNNGGGRKVGVLNMTKGSIITVVTNGDCMTLADATTAEETSKEVVDGKTTYVYTMTEDGILALNMTRYFTIYSISVLAVQADIKVPTIEVSGNTDDIVTVTLACETKGASIYYTVGDGEETLYTEPFTLNKTALVTAWSVKDKAISKTVEKEVVAGHIVTPTATITGVSDLQRTVTLASATADVAIVYSVDNVTFNAYTEPFVIDATTEMWVVASKVSAIDSTQTFVSDTLNTTLVAGEMISLAAPTFAKAALDSATMADYAKEGLAAFTIAANQSSVLCKPTATINYEFFKLNLETGRVSETADLSGVYTDTLKALPYGLLKATASAAGYASAESHIWLKVPVELTEVWSINFDTLAYAVREATGAEAWLAVTYNDVVFNGNYRANAKADFSTVTLGDSVLNPGFVLQTGTSWFLRTNAENTSVGLYSQNSGDRGFGFAGLKKNQIVHVKVSSASDVIYTSGVITPNVSLTDGNDLYYDVTGDGNAVLAMNRYQTIKEVGVFMNPALTQIPEITVDRCDGVDRYVGMTSATLGADIFYALGKEEYETRQVISAIDTVLVSEATEELEAVYRYDTIYTEAIDTIMVYGEYQLYTEPVRISETSHFMAYATYQDLDSEVALASVEAGTTVRIAQPVIKYIETVEGGKKFAITVDNRNVLSTPTTPIYYTLPGGEKTLYTEPIVVANGVYGWITAVAELAGYETSAAAHRYVDSRESYAEVYEAVVAESTVMPAEAADIEFADAPTIHVEQEEALTPTGRVYFHRTMHAGYNSLVLPFNMTSANLNNGSVKITDASGKSLTRGVDYTVYKMATSGTSGKDFGKLANDSLLAEESMIHTANLVGNTQSYLIKVADEYVGQDLIFVSLEAPVLAIAQNSFDAQPAEGWKLVTNKRFQKVVAAVPVYLVNEKGDALVRHEAGTEIPAFTAAVIADTTFTQAHDKIRLIDNSFKPVYKNIAENTIFLPTQENMEAANAELWARNGDEAGGWNTFVYVTNKNATIDPTTGEDCSKAKFPGVGLKNNGPKNVYFYVTNVKSFTAYVVTTGGSDRTAVCTATATDGSVVTGSALSAEYTSARLEMKDLDPTKSYELKFEADADMMLYGINFISGSADGIETIVNDRFEAGVVYDMMGRKVQEVKAGQIYIRDGKKFMQK